MGYKRVRMSKNEYNQLFMLFYVGYLVALWPGAWLSQRVRHNHFITGSLFLWALLLGIHPVVKTGKQMMAVRFLLGMVSLTPWWYQHPWVYKSGFPLTEQYCTVDRISNRALYGYLTSGIFSP